MLQYPIIRKQLNWILITKLQSTTWKMPKRKRRKKKGEENENQLLEYTYSTGRPSLSHDQEEEWPFLEIQINEVECYSVSARHRQLYILHSFFRFILNVLHQCVLRNLFNVAPQFSTHRDMRHVWIRDPPRLSCYFTLLTRSDSAWKISQVLARPLKLLGTRSMNVATTIMHCFRRRLLYWRSLTVSIEC